MPTDTLSPSSTSDPEAIADRVASDPDVLAAFANVFPPDEAIPGDAEQSLVQSGRHDASRRQREEEDAESLASLEEPEDQEDVEGEEDGENAEGQLEPQDREPEDGPPLTLPAPLTHAAERAGWTRDEIRELAAANPDVAARTFQRLFDSQNDLTMRYAKLGEDASGQSPPPEPRTIREPWAAQQRQPESELDEAAGLLAEIYGEERLEALRDKYSSDGADFIGEVLAPLAQRVTEAVTGPVQEVRQFLEAQEVERASQTIGDFFGNMDAEYEGIYGSDARNGHSESISDDQREVRMEMSRLADQYRAGAKLQGHEVSVREALEAAHNVIASKHLEQIERRRLTSRVKSRSRQLTHRPTQRSRPTGVEPGERSLRAAESAVAQHQQDMQWDTM
jgi:hypothetical protein